MKRPRYIKRGVRPEHDSAGIKQIQIGFGHLRAQLAINKGLLPARDAPDDIFDGRRASEGSALAGVDIELAEAVEEVIAAQLAHFGIDAVIGASEWPFGAKGAVQADLGLGDGWIDPEEQEHPQYEGIQ